MHQIVKLIWIPLCLVLWTGCGPQSPQVKDTNAVLQGPNSESGEPENAADKTSAADAEAANVTFEIDYGDGATLIVELAVSDDETSLETLMKRLGEHPHGPELEMKGTGITCFIVAMGGLGTDSGKGWQYEVNDVHAERGVGQTTVKAGDRVRWKHGSW